MVQDEDLGKVVAFKTGPFWRTRWVPLFIKESYVHLTGKDLLHGALAFLEQDKCQPMTEEAMKANPDYMEYIRDKKN
jgi:hypothetical protein